MSLLKILSSLAILTTIYCQNITIDVEEWWGPEDSEESNNSTIIPHQIVFDDDMIEDLRYRLSNYRLSNPTFRDEGFQYGFNSREMPAWIDYWANYYPFAERQDFLNIYPQYKMKVQGMYVHFIRVIPEVPEGVKIIPLLLLHGWPGSVREFYETIPFLTSLSPERNFALEVIVPSLPGFAFSDAATRPGLASAKIAVILRNLMRLLGHYKFCVGGGDWGGVIASDIATLFPKEVIGFHTNYAITMAYKGLILQGLGSLYPPLVVDPALSDRMYPLLEKTLFLLRETGYFHLQVTKPDTIGIALSDSPAGLLAYILQFFSSAANKDYIPREDGGLTHYSKLALIDNLMLYWASNSITSSFRIYTESYNKQFSFQYKVLNAPTYVPTWVLQAANEIIYQSPTILKTKYPNLIHSTVVDYGGHFFALEEPEFYAKDVLSAVQAFLGWRSENGGTE